MLSFNKIQPMFGPKESWEKYLDAFEQLFVSTFFTNKPFWLNRKWRTLPSARAGTLVGFHGSGQAWVYFLRQQLHAALKLRYGRVETQARHATSLVETAVLLISPRQTTALPPPSAPNFSLGEIAWKVPDFTRSKISSHANPAKGNF